VADAVLKSLTALGSDTPKTVEIGGYRITERFDVALASLATRRGRENDVAKAAKAAKLVLPEPARAAASVSYGAFWLSPLQWMIEASFADHEDISGHLKKVFGDAASITEQTDAWVRFDVKATNLHLLFERLCNVDMPQTPVGYAGRTVIEHIGCYLIKREAGEVTLYGPRSMATSLLHALEVTAHSVV
jgi:sarcosine oxidase, subunit gamma